MNTLILKVCVSIDGDGHFHVTELDNRKQVLKDIKNLCDGDVWANDGEENMSYVGVHNEEELFTLKEYYWEKFVGSFIQRGMLELVSFNPTSLNEIKK